MAILGAINYFTLFGYYLPHQTQVIYTWKSNDIFAKAKPQYIAFTEEPPKAISNDEGWYNYYWNDGYKIGYIDGYFNLKSDKPFSDPLEWFDIYNFKEPTPYKSWNLKFEVVP
jgi:hypothetical protein